LCAASPECARVFVFSGMWVDTGSPPCFQATFKKGALHLFLTTAEAGIEQYPDPVAELTVAGLTRYLGFKLSPITDHQRSLVHTFKSEKAFKALGTPVLVKFYKQSCPHCIHYVGTFQRGR
jgi:hypothetical protein